MDLIHFIESRVVVQLFVKCAGCAESENCPVGLPTADFEDFLRHTGWTVRGEKPQCFCGACSKEAK